MSLTLLRTALQVSVPLYMARLAQEPWSRILVRARECAQVVAEKGDIILFRSKKPGQTAVVFNHLAEGIACLAFAPGGVKIFELHFQAQHPEDGLPTSEELAWFTKEFERSIHGIT